MSWLTGVVFYLYILLNTAFWSSMVYVFFVIGLIFPIPFWLRICWRLAERCQESWLDSFKFFFRLIYRQGWDIEMPEGLSKDEYYLIICNHRSWIEIILMSCLLNRRIPPVKFFTKKILIWLPFIGLALWILDFPLMKRYSRETLEKHPELRGKDKEITRRTCKKFLTRPLALINFLEGTRFKPEKHQKQNSPFKHLLKPRAGGIATALEAVPDRFNWILDFTFVFRSGNCNFWDFLCGRISDISVRCELVPIPQSFLDGDYNNDTAFKKEFQDWINEIWLKKDETIQSLLDKET